MIEEAWLSSGSELPGIKINLYQLPMQASEQATKLCGLDLLAWVVADRTT
jgi:hypothetical protein